MEVKVVIGSNYGDESKGLVAYALAKKAAQKGNKILSVLFNGGVQRAHTAGGQIVHCTGTGDLVGGETYYSEWFVVDPIALWLTQTRVYINPKCRIVLPCDVIRNREKEEARGIERHGSCGMGIFECVKRSKDYLITARDLLDPFELYNKLRQCEKISPYNHDKDKLYTNDNFMKAANYIFQKCEICDLDQLLGKRQFDTIIYEGGQGLLLGQENRDDFPYLTPSSPGLHNIKNDLRALYRFNALKSSIYYVSRSYMTRHGAGPMETECSKEDINSEIVDNTNMPNDWQGALRFGYLNQQTLANRILADYQDMQDYCEANLVFTHLNYTNGKILVGPCAQEEIIKPDFITNIYLSDQKDIINRM